MAVSRRALYQPELRDVKKSKKKEHFKSHTFLVWASLFLAIILLLALISRGKQMRVDKIVVEGNKIIQTEELLPIVEAHLEGNYLGLFPRRNILIAPVSNITQDLQAKYPRAASVGVARDGWHTLVVTFSERTAAYNVCEGDDFSVPCYGMDTSGYVFGSAPEFTGALLLAFRDLRPKKAHAHTVGTELVSAGELSRVHAFVQGVTEVFKTNGFEITPVGIRIAADNSYELEVEIGEVRSTILFSEGEAAALLHNLSVAVSSPNFLESMKDLSRPLMYIDLRFGNKVYFKFKE